MPLRERSPSPRPRRIRNLAQPHQPVPTTRLINRGPPDTDTPDRRYRRPSHLYAPALAAAEAPDAPGAPPGPIALNTGLTNLPVPGDARTLPPSNTSSPRK